MPTREELDKGFNLGDWEVLPRKGVMRRGDDEERPENLVWEVLFALAKRDRELISQQELIDEVWDGRAQTNEPIQRCIALLRKHLGDSRPYEYIENLPRRGYRLLKPVVLHEPTDVLVEEPPENTGDNSRLWKIVTAVVVVGFVAIAAMTWLPSKEPAVRSIAILPMENLSGDPANQYIVEGTQYSLVVRLLELSDFDTRHVRQNQDGEPKKIAAALNVESILTSSLQMDGETLKITWQIVRGADSFSVGSGEVTGSIGGVFRLQEQFAKAVRDKLAGSDTPQLVTRPEPESAAYNSFMRGMYLLERRGEARNLEEALALFQESISLDKDFGPAYLVLAAGYSLLHDYRNLPLADTRRLAIDTVEAGVSVDQTIEDAAASIYGFFYHQEKRWHESEQAHLQAVNARVVDANSFNWYSRMLSSVGRREDSLKWIMKAEDIDPDNPVVCNRIALTSMWLGETAKAEEYFRRAGNLGSGGRNQLLGYALLLMRLGRFEEAEDLALEGSLDTSIPTDWVEPAFAGFQDPAQRVRGLAALDRQWVNGDGTLSAEIVLVARTFLGDVDGAMEIAQLLRNPGEVFEMDLLFIPELEPLREHPDFIPLMQDLGVVAYWERKGCVWEGNQVSCALD